MAKRYAWLLLILLTAAALRLVRISDIPPGLTHDEADHGLDAWGVVNGELPVYFTVGNGREPLFDYATAGLMSFLGPSYLAGRLTAVYSSLILLCGVFALVHRAFDKKSALLTIAGLAVSFWAVMTARQALRSIILPAIFTLAVLFYWRGMNIQQALQRRMAGHKMRYSYRFFVIAGILLGATFYTYFPARILWLLFPLILAYLAFVDRDLFKDVWRGTCIMLVVAGLIATPLLFYLITHPGAEERIGQLAEPLTAARQGQFDLLFENMVAGFRLLTFEGDSQWRYNIPGRPVLSPAMAVLFFLGVGLAIWRFASSIRQKDHNQEAVASTLALLWLILGLSPALITGADLSTTRIIGLQPVLYLFPAIAMSSFLRLDIMPKKSGHVLLGILFAVILSQTIRDYFNKWANHPEVRVQYESTLVSAMHHLNIHGQGAAAISSTTPNRFHSPAVALLTLDNPSVDLRWFNGHHSLLIPQNGPSSILYTGFAPLNSHLEPYFDVTSERQIPLRPTDLDRPLTISSVDGAMLLDSWRELFSTTFNTPDGIVAPVQFDQALELIGYDMQTLAVYPGDLLWMATLWRVKQPLDNAVLFTHIGGHDGPPLAQADRLDVPSDYWVNGDTFIQLHQIQIPNSIVAGEYPISIGVYLREKLKRLPIILEGEPVADSLGLPPLTILP